MYKKYLLTLFLCASVESQSNKDLYNGQVNNEFYNSREQSSRSSRLPSPGDTDYRTYVYNNRRYGTDPTRYNPYNPNINQPGGFPYNPINTNPLDDQFKYNINRDPNNPDALFPGVLGGWREDLQGRERRDSRQLKRDVFVTTNYGQVQGFKVYLYDNPDPDSGYRPWLSPVERIQGEVSVFLGIPYARPPVLEGRFKPPRTHPGWQLMQAVDWGPACPQPVRYTGATKGIRDMDEDCLYLNIFSPNSGSALADWAMIEDKFRVQNTSLVFGRLLGCPIDSSWKLVNCLRQGRSFYELGNAEFQPHVGFIPWGPVLENNFTFPGDEWYDGWRERDWHFLNTKPEDLIKRRQFNPSLRYMTGVTTQEAAYYLYKNESLAPKYEISERWFNEKVWELVQRYNYTLNPRGVYEAIRYMYTYHPEPHNVSAIRDQYIHLLSDFLYRAPTDKMVKLLLEQNVPVYMYVLNTTVEAFKFPEWRQYSHDTEHYFLTGAPFMDQEFFPVKQRIDNQQWTNNDRNMSHFFMKTFSDFARFGETDRYYDGDIFMVPEVEESGIDNTTRSRDNIYEYRDVPIKKPHTPQPISRTISQPATLQSSRPPSEASTGSALSLKEGSVSRVPEPLPRARSRTQIVHGIPQTTV
ncbi:hypothetical protein HF086_015966 [Spodoptera exigua]|uniref:Carboxylesterase type B domain-containing protein n=1 Tax=Spodoptera exigua TaxID=7107 RepID=A0A922M198_SPOEX|nr:hypothetical protein HF086_015966 [Spodoptera exigua]